MKGMVSLHPDVSSCHISLHVHVQKWYNSYRHFGIWLRGSWFRYKFSFSVSGFMSMASSHSNANQVIADCQHAFYQLSGVQTQRSNTRNPGNVSSSRKTRTEIEPEDSLWELLSLMRHVKLWEENLVFAGTYSKREDFSYWKVIW